MNLSKMDVEGLKAMPLVEALWWFIENEESDAGHKWFFVLRERYRTEYQGK